jgi:hypothetical protein
MKRSTGNASPATGIVVASILFCLSTLASAATENFQASIDSFFVRMKADFTALAENPAVVKGNPAAIDQVFLKALKQNGVVNELVRTDPKGAVITELARMKEPFHGKKSYKTQSWYMSIGKGGPEFEALTKDTARFYLVWSAPVKGSVTATVKKSPLAGVLMMKIDLWDCFQKLSDSTETPFLVRLNRLNLYTHKWQNKQQVDKYTLAVPGVKTMMLYMEKREPAPPAAPVAAPPAPAAPQPVVAAPSAMTDSTKINNVLSKADSNYSAQKKSTEMNRAKKLGIVAIVAAIVLLLVLIISFISWFRHKMLIRAINKDL